MAGEETETVFGVPRASERFWKLEKIMLSEKNCQIQKATHCVIPFI